MALAGSLLLGGIALASPGGASALGHTHTPSAKAKLLKLSDLPSGWSVNNAKPDSSGGLEGSSCLSGLKTTPSGGNKASASFTEGQEPELNEVLAVGPNEIQRYRKLNKALASCRSITVSTGGLNSAKGTVGAMSFPTIGKQTHAYSIQFTIQGINLGVDIVLFRAGKYVGAIEYLDLGTPDVDDLQALVQKAVDRING
jgi:hypothetical protein